MEPVTLPFGVFAAVSSFAAYGVLRLVKDLRAGKDVFEDIDPEQVMRIVQKVKEYANSDGKRLHIVQ